MLITELFPYSKHNGFGSHYKITQENLEGIRTRDKISLVCLVCAHEFKQRANSVFLGVISCKCSKSYRKTEVELTQAVALDCQSKDLKLISITYEKPLTNSIVQYTCNVCDATTSCSYNNMVFNGVGCTTCTRKYRATREEYVDKLKDIFQESFELVDDLPSKVTSKTSITVKCISCGRCTEKSMAAVLYNKASCQCLATYGYDNSKPGFMYLISLKNDSKVYYKVGVTCDTTRRFRELSYNNNLKVEVLSMWEYPANGPILDHELFLKNHFAMGRSTDKPFEYGYTESVSVESLPMIMTLQNLQYRNIFSGFST